MVSPWTDRELLEMLDLRAAGASYTALGRRFNVRRNAIQGLMRRISRDTEASEHDGTMPPRWWEEGLRKQEAEQ